MKQTLILLTFIFILSVLANPSYAQDPLSKEDAFTPDDHPDVVATFANRDDSQQILDAFVDAGGNWRDLYDAITSFTEVQRDDCIFLVKTMPHLDRLEMSKDTLVEHVTYAWKAKSDFQYTIPDDMFREYILVYRLGDEPCAPYRKTLREKFDSYAGASPTETAKAVNQWVYDNIHIQPRGFFGPRPDPVTVMNAGAGTEEDIANLTVAILKTLGVPARRVRVAYFGAQAGGSSWVEIYDGKWLPLYPDSPVDFGDFGRWEENRQDNITVVIAQSAFHIMQVTGSYSATGTIELGFIKHGVPQPDFPHFGISVYNNGAWQPIDDLDFSYEESMPTGEKGDTVEAVLGDGKYLVQCGVRNHRGDPWVQTRMVDIQPGDKLELEFALDPPLQDLTPADLQVRKLKGLPGFLAGGLDYPDDLKGIPHLVFVFNIDDEMSIRLLPDIVKFRDTYPDFKVLLIHTGASENSEMQQMMGDETGLAELFVRDTSGSIAASWGCPRGDDGSFTSLPATILIDADGNVVLYDEGYNLNLHEELERGMEFIFQPSDVPRE